MAGDSRYRAMLPFGFALDRIGYRRINQNCDGLPGFAP
jgi:hypothetical protein